MSRPKPERSKLSVLILAIGIGVFLIFGVLMFGRIISERTDEASAVLSGEQDANSSGIPVGDTAENTSNRNQNMGGRNDDPPAEPDRDRPAAEPIGVPDPIELDPASPDSPE